MGDIKLIYLLRNPMDQIFSHYWHCIDLGIYRENSNAVLVKDPTLADRSLYYGQLQRYMKYFDADRVHSASLDECQRGPPKVLNEMVVFLGLAPLAAGVTPPSTRYNTTGSRPEADSSTGLTRSAYDQVVESLRAHVARLEGYPASRARPSVLRSPAGPALGRESYESGWIAA